MGRPPHCIGRYQLPGEGEGESESEKGSARGSEGAREEGGRESVGGSGG